MTEENKKNYFIQIVLTIFVSTIYLIHQVQTIYGGDAGDLASAIATAGIPHPPGYPLYTFLGIILNQIIPFGTVAWKVAFLSSIAGIVTVIFLYKILNLVTGKIIIPLIVVLTYAFVYPIWLYSEVVEVFALSNLFIVLLFYFSFLVFRFGKFNDILTVFFLFGLSLTHHHLVIFFLPVILILNYKRVRKLHIKKLLFCCLVFFLGLTPTMYLYFSSLLQPAVNWQGGADLGSLLTLVFRKGYGTFLSSPGLVRDPSGRLMEVWAFFRFFYQDFRLLGSLLTIFGFYYLLLKEKFLFMTISVGTLFFLFFLYYASFPLSSNFGVGTFERFMTPLYLLLSLPLTFGFVQLSDILSKLIGYVLQNKKRQQTMSLVTILFLIYPISIFLINYPKISILKNDFTAENLGKDILRSVGEEGILLIMNDTPLFNTQYIYYTNYSQYQKISLIHFSKLFMNYYGEQIKKYYPKVISSYEEEKGSGEIVKDFLKLNYPQQAIFSKLSLHEGNGTWIPWGLVFRYYQEKDLPDKKEIFNINEKLWTQFQNPLAQSLVKYKNLMLSDVLNVYSIARQEIAVWEIKNGYYQEAVNHLLKAKELTPTDKDVYLLTATAKLKLKKCQEVKEALTEVEKIDDKNPDLYYLHWTNYHECFQDKEKADYYEQKYEEIKKGKETLLKDI